MKLHFVNPACVLILCFASGAASAQDAFFPTNATLDASNPVTQRAFVGYANFDDYLNLLNGTSPTVTMVTGASIGTDMQLFNGSILDMRGGTVGADFGSLLAYDQSVTNMSGGLVGQHVTLQDQARFNLSGGTIGDDFTTVGDSSVFITGGLIGHSLLLNSQSSAFISGGTVASDIFVQDSSSLRMFGSDLTRALTDPNFQDFYTVYTLTGHLADGTDLTNRTVLVQNDSGASFNIDSAAVPEPGTWALTLIGVGLIGSISRRRSKEAATHGLHA